ncbi:serine hydrolase [Rufibacter sp. DG15C]|uniref:serine hydrolase domain-containing protein n=1 Tax=Rufibacter sp. DG15C TaxID=1379909 RepID=UPI000B151EF5|nr:serine hydrolase domain-containing protein [Rufibacter sp. DG15C]
MFSIQKPLCTKPLFLLFLACFAIIVNCEAQQDQSNKIEALLDKAVTLHQFNGTALVTKKGKVLFEKAYGYQNVAEKIPNTSNTVYQIGSTTKQFTAVVVLKLAEQKKLSLQDKLSHYFPNFKASHTITIQQLLSHTSGIYEIFRSPDFYQLDKSMPVSKEKLMSFYLTRPLDFAPGTQFNYCNSGYHLLGQIIEKVTGKPYERVVRELVLEPLKMNHSGFAFTQLNNAHEATGYSKFAKDNQMPTAAWDSTATYLAGAMYSTAHDLFLWH